MELSPSDRLRRLVVDAILAVPAPVRRRLVGPPPRNDRGETLDDDAWWLVALERRFGPGRSDATAEGVRRRMARSAAVVAPARPRAVARVEEVTLAGRPARLYHPGTTRPAVMLYLHGGGWSAGSLDTHDPWCRRLAADAGIAVLSLDYRLAPEHPFPAGLDDASAAYAELRSTADRFGADTARVAIGGDSAGGNLAATVCLAARDVGLPGPDLQLLVYPATDLRKSFPSHRTLGHGYLLEAEDIDAYLAHYAVPDPADPRASVLLASSLRDLPPAVVVTAGFDPLRDEGEAYAEALAAAGVPVRHLHEPSLLHAFLNLDGVLPAADRAVRRITDVVGRWAVHGVDAIAGLGARATGT